jgi:hypothetical protein
LSVIIISGLGEIFLEDPDQEIISIRSKFKPLQHYLIKISACFIILPNYEIYWEATEKKNGTQEKILVQRICQMQKNLVFAYQASLFLMRKFFSTSRFLSTGW